MKDLANAKFDPEKDIAFFNYLDRLMGNDKFSKDKNTRVNGLGILKEFITGK